MSVKIFRFTISVLLIYSLFSSCTKNTDDESITDPLSGSIIMANPQEAIHGIWYRIADAMYVNHISERSDGIYWEFFSNGTVQYCIPSSSQKESEIFINKGTYSIDVNFVVIKPEFGFEEKCRYGFYDNGKNLKLVRADWIPSSGPPKGVNIETVYVTNIIIFQKRNNKASAKSLPVITELIESEKASRVT